MQVTVTIIEVAHGTAVCQQKSYDHLAQGVLIQYYATQFKTIQILSFS